MALCRGIYGSEKVEYEGCVLSTYEHNGAWDSDWYATVWDETEETVKDIEYDTTRAGSNGSWAKIDATEDTIKKVYRYYKNTAKKHFDSVYNVAQAKTVTKGDTVTVVRGRKIPKGTVGEVFWVGKRFNMYSGRDEERVGILSGDEKLFLPIEYVQVNDWENKLIRGKKRKEKIRNAALNRMPYWTLRHLRK